MDPLHKQRCEPCQAGSSALDNDQARQLLTGIPGWHIEELGGVYRLVRAFDFDSFKTAFEFAAQVTAIAEQENHHPLITIEWGKASVQWWTHSIAGLHRNDFIMAAKTQQIAEQ